MKKYFVYGDEYISGWRYWWRQLLQIILIAFFGLGLYLAAVTTYKRSRSLGNSHITALLLAIYFPISVIIEIAIGYQSGYSGEESLIFFNLLVNIPHFYLWFSNGTPPNKSHNKSNESLNFNDKDFLNESENDKNSNKKTIKKKNMKGFKQCEKGHFYKDTLSECNYCPKDESSSQNKTEIIATNNSLDDNFSEKTQLFGNTQQSEIKNESFDPERTIISGSISKKSSDESDKKVQKRKLRAWLVSFDLEDFGVDFKILEGKNTIGSKSSNDITIQDSEVSALQGIILCRKDKFFITDEVSSNGTLLNGNDLEPRKPYDIKDGDRIKIGSTTLLFKTAF
tara:strand:- start:924 stop:1940 length:1017 start_codon:yes stop_codon:yes gene_type:complete